MRRIVAGLEVSIDGYVEGPKGELDWAMVEDEEWWREAFEQFQKFDNLCARARHVSGLRAVLAGSLRAGQPGRIRCLAGWPATKNEIAYARWAATVPHIVLSTTLDRVAWKTTRIVRDVDEIRKLKGLPERNIAVVGGATLVGSLINLGLIDELRLPSIPLILGGGKMLFRRREAAEALHLTQTKQLGSGRVVLTYSTGEAAQVERPVFLVSAALPPRSKATGVRAANWRTPLSTGRLPKRRV